MIVEAVVRQYIGGGSNGLGVLIDAHRKLRHQVLIQRTILGLVTILCHQVGAPLVKGFILELRLLGSAACIAILFRILNKLIKNMFPDVRLEDVAILLKAFNVVKESFVVGLFHVDKA